MQVAAMPCMKSGNLKRRRDYESTISSRNAIATQL